MSFAVRASAVGRCREARPGDARVPGRDLGSQGSEGASREGTQLWRGGGLCG